MKEFIRKWSNWWILNPKRKQLDDAFEKELNELIEREVALRIHDVSGRSEQFCACPFVMIMRDVDTDVAYCAECRKEAKEN